MKDEKIRVLVIAEAANPEWVSVPLVGWSLASALRDVADVHIVTQIRNYEAFIRAGLVEGQDFTAIDSEVVARPIAKLSSILSTGNGRGWTAVTALQSLAYPYFERVVWQNFGADIRAGRFDIVHRVTPLTPTTVSSLAARCARAGVPFVLGPLNGGVPWPKGFDRERRREREWLSYIRGVHKLFPGRQRMLRATSAIIAGSRHTASEIPDAYQFKVVWLPENAIDPTRFNLVSAQDLLGPLRACFIGRLVPYKGPDMVLEALGPMLQSGRMQLDIIGDGPMMSELQTQVAALGVMDAVAFHGNLPHEKVQTIASQSNLLTFPSIREFGGGVVLEAMALGVVPVIVDYAGPGELVNEGLGYKIPIGTRAEIVASLRNKVTNVIEDPSALPELSKAARAHALTYFTWTAKAAQVQEVYSWVLGRLDKKPKLF